MNSIEQLWALQQIYQSDSYYDAQTDLYLHRIPANFSTDTLDMLKRSGHMPNQFVCPQHDDIWDTFYSLTDTWTLSEAVDAFLAGLWSAPFLWLSALSAKLLAQATPKHSFTPYLGSTTICTVCGFQKKSVDTTLLWHQHMTSGLPLDGDPVGYVYALQEMAKSQQRPTPTNYDLWTFRAILTVIRQMPPKSRYSKVRDALQKEKLLPTSQKGTYCSLLEALALIGILDTPAQPGMATQFTSYQERDLRPSVRVEVQAPLAWWNSSIGINELTLKKIFGEIDCSCVCLTDRPTPIPPLPRTITGALKTKKAPRKKLPTSPDAGKGPVQSGDVYAIRIRDDIWISVYCHAVEGSYTIVEYLDGIFSEMPMKEQLPNVFRLRDNQRWQTKTSGIDRTSGVKRIARNIPAPQTDLPAPDRITFSTAANLAHLAGWCFHELLSIK